MAVYPLQTVEHGRGVAERSAAGVRRLRAVRLRRKHSGTWQRLVGQVQQSLNLQKSQHSLRYYLNVELALSEEDPRACIKGRAGALLAEVDRERLDALLDLDGHQMPEERREAELLDLLGSLTPLLNEFASAADLAAHDRRGTFKAMGITGPARSVMDRV